MSHYYIGKKPKKRKRPSSHTRRVRVGKRRTGRRNVLVNPHIKKITKQQYNKIRRLNPKGDYDKDGVKNKDDCYPFDENRHGALPKVKIGNKVYFLDERLNEMRNINDFTDVEKMEGSKEFYLKHFGV